MRTRVDGRQNNELRPMECLAGFQAAPDGSVFYRWGNTHVICSATIEARVPKHRLDKGGWLTAEYNMLPGSGEGRISRPKGQLPGRTAEIQRLIGRSLRAVVDIDALPPITITLDCDVVNADGGTRCASITAAYIALKIAMERYQRKEGITLKPIAPLAAVSVGIVEDEILTDLCYEEDARAHVDMNVIASGLDLVEVQGTGESGPFSRQQFDALLDAGLDACAQIQKFQTQMVERWLSENS